MLTKKSFALAVALTCLAGVASAASLVEKPQKMSFMQRVKVLFTGKVAEQPKDAVKAASVASVTSNRDTVAKGTTVTSATRGATVTSAPLVAGEQVDLGPLEKSVVTWIPNAQNASVATIRIEDSESAKVQDIAVPSYVKFTVVKGVVGYADGKLLIIEPDARPRVVDAVTGNAIVSNDPMPIGPNAMPPMPYTPSAMPPMPY